MALPQKEIALEEKFWIFEARLKILPGFEFF
jgi:hypothetical protein